MTTSSRHEQFFRVCLKRLLCLAILVFAPIVSLKAVEPTFEAWLESAVSRIEQTTAQEFESVRPDNWAEIKRRWRSELMEMLGLPQEIDLTDLAIDVTSTMEHEDVVVDSLHYQSAPGLYVTANLFRPKSDPPKGGWPAVLYVCGHAQMKEHGKLLGNKTGYHHHGLWFARHGVVCLTIDTIQLGELHGEHHGTYKLGRWDWITKGYTPAGVEALNAVRGIDVLQSLEYVNDDKLGITGRSGGGAYSWFAAAIDERIKVAVPVAGITDLRNHVVDRCVNGHCDCMYFVNQYHWDYGKLAALVAPRPLLLANSDNDSIFPLDGVMRIHQQLKNHYERLGASQNFGLIVTPGPHQDTQELQVGAFKWLLRNLNGEVPVITRAATKDLDPKRLTVFANQIPKDERVTSLPGWFTHQIHISDDLSTDYESYQAELDAWMMRTQLHSHEPSEFESLSVLNAFKSPDELGEEYEVQFLKHSSLPWRLVRIARAETQGTILHCDAFPLEVTGSPESITSSSTVASWLKQLPTYTHYWVASPLETWKQQAYSAGRKTEFARQLYLLGTSVDRLQLEELQQSQFALETSTSRPLKLASSNRNVALAILLANSGAQKQKSKRTVYVDRFTEEELPSDLILPGLARWTSFQEMLRWTKQKNDFVNVTTQSVSTPSINQMADRPYASTGYQVSLTSSNSAILSIRTTKWPLPNLGDLPLRTSKSHESSTPTAMNVLAGQTGYASPGTPGEVRLQYRCDDKVWQSTDWISTNAENGFQATFTFNELQENSTYALRFQGRLGSGADEYNLASGSFQTLPQMFTSKPFKLAVFAERPRFSGRDGGFGYSSHITLLNRGTAAIMYARDDFGAGSSLTLSDQQYLGLPTSLALNQSVAFLRKLRGKEPASFDSYEIGGSTLLIRLTEQNLRDSKSVEEVLKLTRDYDLNNIILIYAIAAASEDSDAPWMSSLIAALRESRGNNHAAVLSIEAVLSESSDSDGMASTYSVVGFNTNSEAIQNFGENARQSLGYLELSFSESERQPTSISFISQDGRTIAQHELK